jgi:phosphotransferase system HPr-like phosphotransfer protein
LPSSMHCRVVLPAHHLGGLSSDDLVTFVMEANRHLCAVHLRNDDGVVVDCKRITEVVRFVREQHGKLILEAVGQGAEECQGALWKILEERAPEEAML